jgi:alkylation response protein AidB-like acyl-CoA dehydrogenase
MTSPALDSTSFDALRTYLDGRWRQIREVGRELAAHPDYRPEPGLDIDQHRARILKQLTSLAATGSTGYGFPVEFGRGRDLGASITAFEMLALGDLSLLVGYLCENRLADLKADTDVFTTFEENNTVLLQLVSKELLTKLPGPFRRSRCSGHGAIRGHSDRRDGHRANCRSHPDSAPGRRCRT